MAMPSLCRSKMLSRSNSAIAPNTVSINRPCGVVVSILSLRLMNSTPLSDSSAVIASRSRTFRAIREILSTMTTSPERIKAIIFWYSSLAFVLLADVYTSLVDGKLINMVEGYDAKTGDAVTLNFGTVTPLTGKSKGAVYAYKASTTNNAEYEWDATNTANYVTVLLGTDITAGTYLINSKPFSAGVKFIYTVKNGNGDIIGVTVKEGKVESTYYAVMNAAAEVASVVVTDDADVSVGTDVLMVSKVTGTTVKDYNLVPGAFYTFSETDGIYTMKAYTATGKATSVIANGTLTRGNIVISDTARYIAAGFEGDLALNVLDSVVIDLTDTGKGFASAKDLYDAGYNAYTVSVIYDESTAITKGNVAYIYVLGANV